MVSSYFTAFKNTQTRNSRQLLFPMTHSEALPVDNVELEFSDIFGPLPGQALNDVNNVNLGSSLPAGDESELTCDDLVVIHSRSHSLVGPSACVSQPLKKSNLTIHEIEDSMEFLECFSDEEAVKAQELVENNSAEEESLVPNQDDSVKIRSVGLEDFEVLKVVGQGAFAKVFQVKKKGTSEVYAMKVMRKDRIMEKNHAEYMKAERDILTKIDHPFIVQLRYSFQVILRAHKRKL